MTVVGLDDTDSAARGMCTTYLAARLADRLATEGTVERRLLVRLCPSAPHKTRGNAALAVHADVDADRAFELAADLLDDAAETADPETHPGLVVAAGAPEAVSEPVARFARDAVRELLALDDALAVIGAAGYRSRGWKTGRGRIGALAAVGAWAALDDWTVEQLAYREPDRWGTERDVEADTVFAAADAGYPAAWDTVDRVEGEAVCVPHTPGPVLYGIRGDDAETVAAVAHGIDSEPVERSARFMTNQGTDAHLRAGRLGGLEDGRSYRVDGTVASAPETREGGHVFLTLGSGGGERREAARSSSGVPDGSERPEGSRTSPPPAAGGASVRCAAFEPTKRFRDRVRALRPGDRVTACGEVADGTLKLEKFAVRSLVTTEPAVPDCPDCGRSMESAGRDQGYRCRACGTSAPGKVERPVDRELEVGWYEVPPVARRHVAKPLVRGGFDAPVHPER